MDFKDSVRASLATADFFAQAYLGDLTSQELLVRPLPGANHIAWQLGHLIGAERALAEAAVPGSMPALPAGFSDRHAKSAAGNDDPANYLSKEQYLSLAKEVRASTLRALDQISPADLNLPAAGKVPPFVKRRGDALVTIGGHWILHSGQWALLRRKLGRPVMFYKDISYCVACILRNTQYVSLAIGNGCQRLPINDIIHFDVAPSHHQCFANFPAASPGPPASPVR